MTRNIVYLLVLFTVGVFMAGCQKMSDTKQSPVEASPSLTFSDHQKLPIVIDSKTMTVEVVTTSASIQQGLSGRSEIGAEGMLFVFERPQVASFWMKEMKFELDLIWIKDNEVVGITANVPYPAADTPVNQLPTYPSPGVVTMVLEVPAGTAAEAGIKPGSRLTWSE